VLSVSVHKDIGEYTEKVVGKLSTRTLACVAGGLLAAVGAAAYVYLVLHIDVSYATLPVMACSMPFWLAGFWRPKGMKVEEFIPLWWQHTFTDDRIEYQAGFLSADGLTESIAQKADRKSKRKTKKKGAELHDHGFIAQGEEAREEES
jgi:hypothetical protein